MVCYYPKPCVYGPVNAESGKKSVIISTKLQDKFQSGNLVKPDLWIPCGQCSGCRLDYSIKWACRCLHEKEAHDETCFVTLTYAPEYVPSNMSLVYKDFQDFMKRLRKSSPNSIRFFMAGEYGDKNLRPHYHAILFGCDFDDKQYFRKIDDYVLYTSETLARLWKKGFCTIGDVNFSTVAYVARYIFKKVIGLNAKEFYKDRKAPFCQMSRDPGLGSEFFYKFSDDLYSSDKDFYKNRDRIVMAKVSRYFDKLLEREDPDLFEMLKLDRDKRFKDKVMWTHRNYMDAKRMKDSSIKRLFRSLDELE